MKTNRRGFLSFLPTLPIVGKKVAETTVNNIPNNIDMGLRNKRVLPPMNIYPPVEGVMHTGQWIKGKFVPSLGDKWELLERAASLARRNYSRTCRPDNTSVNLHSPMSKRRDKWKHFHFRSARNRIYTRARNNSFDSRATDDISLVPEKTTTILQTFRELKNLTTLQG